MGRTRASLSKSDLDRSVQEHVAMAERAIERALMVCHQAKRGKGVEARRSMKVARELARVKSALSGVGRLTPLHDGDDPDLMTENDRNAAWRLKLVEERAAGKLAELEAQEALVHVEAEPDVEGDD